MSEACSSSPTPAAAPCIPLDAITFEGPLLNVRAKAKVTAVQPDGILSLEDCAKFCIAQGTETCKSFSFKKMARTNVRYDAYLKTLMGLIT